MILFRKCKLIPFAERLCLWTLPSACLAGWREAVGVRASQAAPCFREAELGRLQCRTHAPPRGGPKGRLEQQGWPSAAAGRAAPQTEGLCGRQTVSGAERPPPNRPPPTSPPLFSPPPISPPSLLWTLGHFPPTELIIPQFVPT